MNKFTLTQEQINFLQAKFDKRIHEIHRLLPIHKIQLEMKTVAEQKELIEKLIQKLLPTLNSEIDTQSVEFIAMIDTDYIRFDSITGNVMLRGWVIQMDNGQKMFISGEKDGKVVDKQIEEANTLTNKLFGLPLKNLLSGKFPVIADWRNVDI